MGSTPNPNILKFGSVRVLGTPRGNGVPCIFEKIEGWMDWSMSFSVRPNEVWNFTEFSGLIFEKSSFFSFQLVSSFFLFLCSRFSWHDQIWWSVQISWENFSFFIKNLKNIITSQSFHFLRKKPLKPRKWMKEERRWRSWW
jgi:hypothetical protein